MVRGVKYLATLADDQPLRSRAALIGGWYDVFVVIASGLPVQSAFAILKDRAVVAVLVPLTLFNTIQSGLQINWTLVDDSAILVLQGDLRNEGRP